MDAAAGDDAGVLRDARELLGVDRLVLAIHGPSFPGDPASDVGAGCPASAAGERFLEFVQAVGFTGVQLGPQGETSEGNPSPYDGTLFARSRLTVALDRLVRDGLLAPQRLDELVAARPSGSPTRVEWSAHRAQRLALADAFGTFAGRRGASGDPLAQRLADFRTGHRHWLERDALFEAVTAARHGAPLADWDGVDRDLWTTPAATARRAELRATQAETIARYEFEQWLAHEHHAALQATCGRLGLELWGDVQIGISARDAWAYRELFLADYALGAPPSRTNPEGQTWNYPVLDPSRPGEELVAARFDKAFREFDGLRLDHPHGYVCPWVYRTDTPDALAAVQHGARLFAAPDLSDHPGLARFAIARRADLNRDPTTRRWADDWVVELSPAQVARYGRLVDVVLAAARRNGRGSAALACEVLSTCPYPLRRVLQEHGLGRFRVTQKVDLGDPADPYRSENAAPADWIMVGTHDTKPIWLAVDAWQRDGSVAARAGYLAARLAAGEDARTRLAQALAASPALLVQAQFADLFASRARQVLVFFADAFGLRDLYNRPGEIHPGNWSVRLAPDYRARYRERLRTSEALDLPLALALALGARGPALDERARAVRTRLLQMATAHGAPPVPAVV